MSWLAGYKYRRPYVIPAAKALEANAAWTSFVRINADAVFGGHIVDPVNFTDFVFTDADGSTPLSFERRNPVVAAGEFSGDLFVKHAFEINTAKTLYAYYGKVGDAEHADPPNAWGADCAMMMHGEEAASPLTDSLGVTVLTVTGADLQQAGKVGYAIDNATAGDRIVAGQNANINALATITLAAWVWFDTTGIGTTAARLWSKGEASGWYFTMWAPSAISFVCMWSGGTTYVRYDFPVTAGQWQRVILTYSKSDPANIPICYVQGVPVDAIYVNNGAAGTAKDDSAFDLVIGNLSAANKTFDGRIDEAGVWNTIWTPERAEMDFADLSDPAAWGAWGAEESAGRSIAMPMCGGMQSLNGGMTG